MYSNIGFFRLMDINGNFGIRPLTEPIRTEVDFTEKNGL
jgi:hypothetical protein